MVNRKLSDIKSDTKDEDRDSGMKIGEESLVDTEEDEVWTEYSYSEEDEDFYGLKDNNVNGHTESNITNEQNENVDSRKICEQKNSKNMSNSTIKSYVTDYAVGDLDNDQSEENGLVTNITDSIVNSEKTDRNRNSRSSNAEDRTIPNTSEHNVEDVYEHEITNVFSKQTAQEERNCVTTQKHPDSTMYTGSQHSALYLKDSTQVAMASVNQVSNESTDIELDTNRPQMSQNEHRSETHSSLSEDSYHLNEWNENTNADKSSYEKVKALTVSKGGTDNNTGKAQEHIFQDDVSPQFDGKFSTQNYTGVEFGMKSTPAVNNSENSGNSPDLGEINYVEADTGYLDNTKEHNIEDKLVSPNIDLCADKEMPLINSYHYNGCSSYTAENGWSNTVENTHSVKSENARENQLKQALIVEEKELYRLKKQEEEKAKVKALQQKENYINELKSELDSRLEYLGFTRSKSVDFKYDNGDSCLMSLLDQMNREDQDFKVWDRDDYSFLRWFVTKQMENHIIKKTPLPFLEMIEGDPIKYVEKISEDYVPLDETFLTAAALIFNKDIIICPSSDQEDVKVLYGGPGSTKGKGSPLYLGSINPGNDVPLQYYSILPDPNCKTNFVYGEAADRKVSVIGNEHRRQSCPSPRPIRPEATNPRSWKRMDSYTGSTSKDLDGIINEVKKAEDLNELFQKLDQCEDKEEDVNTYYLHSSSNSHPDVDNYAADLVHCEDGDAHINTNHMHPYTNGYTDFDTDATVAEAQDEEEQVKDTFKDHVIDSCNYDNDIIKTGNLGNNYNGISTEEAALYTNGYYDGYECAGDQDNNLSDALMEGENMCDDNLNLERSKSYPASEEHMSSIDNIVLPSDIVNEYSGNKLNDLSPDTSENNNTGIMESIVNSGNPRRVRKIKISISMTAAGDSSTTQDSDASDTLDVEQRHNGDTNDVHTRNYDSQEQFEAASSPYGVENSLNSDSNTNLLKVRHTQESVKECANEESIHHEGDSEAVQSVNSSNDNTTKASNNPTTDTPIYQASDERMSSIEYPHNSRQHISVNAEGIRDNRLLTSNVELVSDINANPVSLTTEANGNTTEVKMRQKKYSRRKSTASYRWSGVEMCQVDGPPTCTMDTESASGDSSVVKSTIDIPDLTAQTNRFLSTLSEYRLNVATPTPSKCKDSCLVALLDQMSRCGDDYKVWDKDDHTFLYWYICKQMEIQISSGNGAGFLNLNEEHTTNISNQFQNENSMTDEYFLRAFSRIFNRDVIVLSNDNIEFISGKKGMKRSKGSPLLIGKLHDKQTGYQAFSSLEPCGEATTEEIVECLHNLKS